MTQTATLLPGTEVVARGLRWEVVTSEHFGPQTMYRLRGLENAVLGQEFDVLSPFETPMAVQPRSRRDWFPFVSEITPEIQPVGRPRHICTLAFSEQSSSARRGKSGVVAQRPRFIAVWESFFTHVGVSSK